MKSHPSFNVESLYTSLMSVIPQSEVPLLVLLLITDIARCLNNLSTTRYLTAWPLLTNKAFSFRLFSDCQTIMVIGANIGRTSFDIKI